MKSLFFKSCMVLIILLLFIAFLSYGNNNLSSKLIEVTGFDKQLESFSASIYSQINSVYIQLGLEPANDEKVSSVNDSIRSIIINTFNKYYNKETYEYLISWFETELGRKILALEKSVPDSIDFSLSEKKKALINELIKTAQIEEFTKELKLSMGTIILKSMTLPTLIKQGKTKEEIENFYSSQKFKDVINKNIQTSFNPEDYYSTYGSLEEKELKKYIEFYKLTPGQSLLQIEMESIINCTEFLASKIGRELGFYFTNNNGNKLK